MLKHRPVQNHYDFGRFWPALLSIALGQNRRYTILAILALDFVSRQRCLSIVRVRTCNFHRRLPRERKRTIELSYIYDFGPTQCNQAVPASSDKSADALA